MLPNLEIYLICSYVIMQLYHYGLDLKGLIKKKIKEYIKYKN